MEEIDNWWDEEEEEQNEEQVEENEEREETPTTTEDVIEERIRREYETKQEADEQRIKELEEQLIEKQNEEDPSPIQDMKIIIQDLLKEVKFQLGDLSEEEEDIYTDIKRAMRQDQDEETMRGYEEELRKILNK